MLISMTKNKAKRISKEMKKMRDTLRKDQGMSSTTRDMMYGLLELFEGIIGYTLPNSQNSIIPPSKDLTKPRKDIKKSRRKKDPVIDSLFFSLYFTESNSAKESSF